MANFLGKFIKYVLWLCLIVLLGTFFFGLIQFKGNLVGYVSYLNSIEIGQLFSISSLSQNVPVTSGAILVDSGSVLSGEFEGEFLPEAGTLDENDFGFSGALDGSGTIGKITTGENIHSGSISAEALVDLVTSKEK